MENLKRWLKRIKKCWPKIKEFTKDNLKEILIFGASFIINSCFFVALLHKSSHGLTSTAGTVGFVLLLVVTILSVVILFIARKNAWKLEKIFLFLGSLIGVFYLIAMPVSRAPDEPAHFWRAYEVANLDFFPTTNEEGEVGYYVPENLRAVTNYGSAVDAYQDILSRWDERASENLVFQTDGPADGYFFINYIPQAFGIWIARLFNLSLMPTYYLARICSFIFCMAVLYFSIKFAPKYKKFIFFIALLPISIQAIISCSADGSILSAGIAFAVFFLRGLEKDCPVFRLKDYIILFFIILFFCITKPVYAVLCPLLFFIPKEKFGTKKHKLLWIFGIGTMAFAFLALKTLTTPGSGSEGRYGISSLQIEYMLNNPITFLITVARTVIKKPYFYINEGIGSSLEWFDVSIPEIVYISMFIIFILLCVDERRPVRAGVFAYIISGLFVSMVGIFAALYISWSELGASEVDGVQGRYFLPLAVFFLMAISPIQSKRTLGTGTDQKPEIIRTGTLVLLMSGLNILVILTTYCAHI